MIPWSRKWQPIPVFWPEKFHGLAVTVHGVTKVRHSEWLSIHTHSHTHTHTHIEYQKIGKTRDIYQAKLYWKTYMCTYIIYINMFIYIYFSSHTIETVEAHSFFISSMRNTNSDFLFYSNVAYSFDPLAPATCQPSPAWNFSQHLFSNDWWYLTFIFKIWFCLFLIKKLHL